MSNMSLNLKYLLSYLLKILFNSFAFVCIKLAPLISVTILRTWPYTEEDERKELQRWPALPQRTNT